MKQKKAFAIVAASTLAFGLAACSDDSEETPTNGDTQTTGESNGEVSGESPGNRASMIVPFSAGGGSDQSGRAIAAGFESVQDITVTVENIEGGSGAVGYSNFLGQDGSGTALLATETALMALPLVQDVQFTYEDFTPIMKVGDDYTLIVVQPDSEWETCMDVVDAAKADGVMAAVSGATSLDEVVFSLIENDQDVTFDRLPYESGGEVLAGLLGGHVEVASLNPSEVIGQLNAGDLKALCAVAPERYEFDELAEIPTAIEQGIDVAFAQFRGVIAAGGISDEHKNFWIETGKAWEQEESYMDYIDSNYMQAEALYGDEFKTYLDEYNENLKIALGK